jgi:CP family cyanate transporter-like MFS transporter
MEIQNDSKWIKKRWVLILGIIFLAFNLRPAITAVGPLIAIIQKSLGINNLEAGLLTTIPLIAFAVLSPLVAKFSRRWGNEKTLFLALLILTAGIFTRYSHQLGFLYAGTLIIGSGIAVMNVLLPSVIKSDFPKRIGLMTSIYTTAMCAMAGLASGVSVPLAEGAGLGWEKALVVWGFLAIIGIALWIPQLKANQSSASGQAADYPHPSIWKSRTAWYISIFFGFQSFVFYCLIAWLPAVLLSKGMNENTAGWMLLFVQIIGLPSTFLAPIIASRLKKMGTAIIVIGLLNLLGFGGLIAFHQAGFLIASIAMIGLSTGGSISIAYMIISSKAKDHRQAAELSGMAQAAGYFLAAFGPVLLGFTFDQTNRWLEPLLLILLANAFMVFAGTRAMHMKAKIN